MGQDHPEPTVLYGHSSLHDSLCFLDEQWARGAADDVTAVINARTVGDLRALEPKLKFLSLPIDLADHGDDPDDEPWSTADCGAIEDGDWPPMPTQTTLEFSNRDVIEAVIAATGATKQETVINGPYLEIPPSSEQNLVKVLGEFGYQVVRDDQVVAVLGRTADVW
ncbi:hypothetical protein [Nakamurella lactea]|uniref:hypothetical protein n=1 Tax=Nakamurella lactea TaxID=459515 RepID=UPI000405957E|nr:hypothetical protein [Nakamurella lactea]